MRTTLAFLAIFTGLASTVAGAACPFGELVRRGEAPPELAARYLRGEGAGDLDHLGRLVKRDGAPADPASPGNGPPALDPLSGVLSPIGLGALVPRDLNHQAEVAEHIHRRTNEPDDEVDETAKVLTPKAHRRHFEKKGLLGGVLAPLTGPLQFLDVPTPQDSGLKAIPGNDPNHRYIAPRKTDVRGDCPTLNTLANHGYLSRTGITTFAEAANAIQEAFSMSFDIAVALSALGLLAGGDPITGKYSIGGQDARVPNTVGPSLGIDRHGTFEIDASVSRGDWYFGDNHSLNLTRWDKLVSDANTYGNGLFTIDALKRNARDQVIASRSENPQFAMGANFAVIYATRALLARPLPNGTNPDIPDYKNVAPFYLEEKFPDNWYRIPNSYSLADLGADIADLFLFAPQPLGYNHNGKFVPLEVDVPTEPELLSCFALTLFASFAPGFAQPGVQAVNAVVNQILNPLVKAAGCNISSYAAPGISNAYAPGGALVPVGKSASGSGISGQNLYAITTKPTGLSAGQTLGRRLRRAISFGRD